MVTGVIYIGGAGALGYFNDPKRSSKQFIIHPRTGYLFRMVIWSFTTKWWYWVIEILGREDTQVKVNGFVLNWAR